MIYGQSEAQEDMILADLKEHDRLSPEIRQFLATLRFHWPASLAHRMIAMRLPPSEIFKAYTQMEEARLNDDRGLQKASLSLGDGAQLSVRERVDALIRDLPRRGNSLTSRPGPPPRRTHHSRKAKRQPLPQMCAFGSGGRMGVCRQARGSCACWKAVANTYLSKKAEAERFGPLSEGI